MYLSQHGIQPVSMGAEWACRLGSLRYLQFDGRPIVHVSPAEWMLDPQVIRQMAHDRRYVEIPPPDPGVLSFRFTPDGFPVRLYDNPPLTPANSRQRWLAKKLAADDQVWISLRHARLSRDQVIDVAYRNRMGVVAEFADPGDRVLLLGGTPGQRPKPLPRTVLGVQLGSTGCLTIGILAGLAVSGVGALAGWLTGTDWLLILSVLAAIPLVSAGLLWMHAVPRSSRIAWLTGEFDGSPGIKFHPGTYGLSAELAAQISAAFGYFFTAWLRKPNGQFEAMTFARATHPGPKGTNPDGRTSDTGGPGRP